MGDQDRPGVTRRIVTTIGDHDHGCVSLAFMIATSVILSKNTDVQGHCYGLWVYLLVVMLLDICSSCFASRHLQQFVSRTAEGQSEQTIYEYKSIPPVAGIVGFIWGIYICVHYTDDCMQEYRQNMLVMFWIAFAFSILNIAWYWQETRVRAQIQVLP